MPASKPKRLNWGKEYKSLPQLNLLETQRESYQWFIEEGIKEALAEISPIDDFTGKNWQLAFGGYHFDNPRITPSEAIKKGLTYDAPLRVKAALINKKTGRKIAKEVFLGDIPQITERATFIINGIERGVINQIIRAPGAFFFGEIDRVSGRLLHNAEIRPLRGSWLELNINRNDVISCRLDRRRKFPVTVLLRAFGLVNDEEIIGTFKDLVKEGKIKEFYEQISDILRHYIEHRFNLRAPERTTEEFLIELATAEVLGAADKEDLGEFLKHCDLVKFARYNPATEQIQKTFDLVKNFIEKTKSDEKKIDVTETYVQKTVEVEVA